MKKKNDINKCMIWIKRNILFSEISYIYLILRENCEKLKCHTSNSHKCKICENWYLLNLKGEM